jgi:site-specific DNA-methyltransferase (adenine-specific)
MEIFGTDIHKIIHGDALRTLRTQVADNSVDLIFADPPYNIGKILMGTLKNGRQRKPI